MPFRLPYRLRNALLTLLAVALAAGSWSVAVPATAEATTRTPIMQRSQVGAAGIAAWFRANEPRTSEYRATVSPEALARYFVEEGRAEGVAGDLAFAQSVLETGWFRWPSHGQVHATYNNFSGIGACDGGTCTVAQFRTARIGVRAQIQHLRAYADPTVTVATLANPLESPRFHLVSPKGKASDWEQMGGGNWATDPQYATKILSLYRSMRAHAAANGGEADPGPGSVTVASRFTDVPSGHAHERGIESLVARDIAGGCTETRFCPGSHATRGDVAVWLSKTLELPAGPQAFRDVAGEQAVAADALRAAGITDGCTADRFCPDDRITRGQIARFLQRAMGLPESEPPFADARRSVHAPAIGAVARAGIANGYPDGTYRPGNRVTRGQAASLVERSGR